MMNRSIATSSERMLAPGSDAARMREKRTLRGSTPLARWLVILAAPLWALPRVASAEDKSSAIALFYEAGRLVDEGAPGSACPKYEESLRLYESVNTRYFLADCYERVGRTASAWSLFLDVALKAANNPSREAKARARADALKPRVSYLTVEVDPENRTSLNVTRDGIVVGEDQWNVPIPIDAGTHVLEASAMGKRPWTSIVDIRSNQMETKVTVPPLEDAEVRDAPPIRLPETSRRRALSPPAPTSNASRRTTALLVGGAGILGMGIGTALAFSAKSTFDEAEPYCNGDRCEQRGLDLRTSALSRARIATAVFGVGVVGVSVATVLLITLPKVPKTVATMNITMGGVVLEGTF